MNFKDGRRILPFLLITGLAASCTDDDPMEEAGEKADEAVEDAGEAVEDAAEAVDDAVDDEGAKSTQDGGGSQQK